MTSKLQSKQRTKQLSAMPPNECPTAPDAAAGVSGFLPPIKLNNVAHATAVEPRGQPQGHVPVNGRTDGKQVRRAVASERSSWNLQQ